MKKNKKIVIIIALCLVVACLLVGIYSIFCNKIPAHNIAVINGKKINYVDVDNLSTKSIKGKVVDGKGETKDVNANGLLLRDAISPYIPNGLEKLEIIADDGYTAILEARELLEVDIVFLVVEDSKANLIVFGDKDSKRNVMNITKINIYEK